MWLRSPSQGPWGFHGHGIWIGCPHVSSGAANQVTAYRNGRNGLASNARDNGPRPGVVTWSDALDAWQGGGSPKPPAPELKDFPDPGPQIFETVRGGGERWRRVPP
ncbi:hypothetical protein [Microlunatus sp. Y2014]|uniref:hypothetical protein n=1 Tax=Microlunatus sp. Y2014 TaxID=3418488 RepID=UPI003DA70872